MDTSDKTLKESLHIKDLIFLAEVPEDFEILLKRKSWARQHTFDKYTPIPKNSVIVDYENKRLLIDIRDIDNE